MGVHDDAIEVLCDATFIGGTTLHGRCNGNCGTMLLREHLLNLSKPQPVALPGEWLVQLFSKGGLALARQQCLQRVL